MSIYVTSHVWHNSQHRGTALLLALALADQANDEGVCWPSVATLANKTRLSDRTVQNLMPLLIDTGEVVVLRESRGGHSPRVYQVIVPPRPQPQRHIRRGASSSPRTNGAVPEVKPAQSRGEKTDVGVKVSEPGVQLSVARGEARFTQTVLTVNEPSSEPDEPSHARAREALSKDDESLTIQGRANGSAAARVEALTPTPERRKPDPPPRRQCGKCGAFQDEMPKPRCANRIWHDPVFNAEDDPDIQEAIRANEH